MTAAARALEPLDDHRHALAAADAHRLEAEALVLVSSPLMSVVMMRAPVMPKG